MSGKKIAVFIDAENVSFEDIPFVFEKLSNFGEVVVKKAYADWSNQALLVYKNVLVKFAIEAVHGFTYVAKKNSSDILMTVDIIEILLTRQNIDIFAIVSSDSDFTPVCRKIIDKEKIVIGFGKSQTLNAFQNVCTKFITFPNKESKKQVKNNKNKTFISPNEEIIKKANELIDKHSLYDWFSASRLNAFLKEEIEDFNIKDYGFTKFTSFLQSLDIFDINNTSSGSFIKIKRIIK